MTDMTCEEVEAALPAVVDGESVPRAAEVLAHLDTCAECRQSRDQQVTVRAVLRARAAQLSVAAPPGLRTRVAAAIRDRDAAAGAALGWRGRLSAFAAAAVLVMVIGSIALPLLTTRSTILLAAQLALDHIKCFVIEGDGVAPITAAEATATLEHEYGFALDVPETGGVNGLRLIAVRRCLYGDGRAAHLLYMLDDTRLSLFIIPGLQRPAAELSLLNQDQVIWNDGRNTYMLVARAGQLAQLQGVASRLRNEAK